MDDATKAEFESQSQLLRVDLKAWESDWAKAHKGKKPGRDDIKANPEIAQKYKQYNKVRDIIAGKVPPPAKENPKPKKRRSDIRLAETPTKRTKHFETPSKKRTTDYDVELMNSPATSRKLFSPASVTSLGPTPQRDGRVLGLFDLLVEKELGTPSKTDTPRKKGAQRRIDATPSKRFTTPVKNRHKNSEAFTPTSVSKLQFDTPAFLKRHTLPALDENNEFDAPAPLRLPRKPMVRGLSEIVASLRKVEDDVLDDDLEALRELEGEEMGQPKPQPAPPSQPKDDVLAEDSQVRQLPLGGFDDEGKYDSEGEQPRGRDGNPLRLFKKKGQKRTTKRSRMKPIFTKRPENMGPENMGDTVGSDVEKENAIPETQGEGDDADFEDLESKKAKKTKKPATKPAGVVKKAARKVNELAHANFQRLKLRNNGAKGGPGYGSKFRRRR
ncbi:DNA replication regulator sld2 [Neonectria magnoliae]|uniref:DNA replication regulator SLD2 n=1 Tax=Neonectria magnoliae TaxID=2732573 RepID=A0ABR1IFN3_9HYPO